MPRISIEGNISSGKTYYIDKLKQNGYLVHKYPNEINQYPTDVSWYSNFKSKINTSPDGILSKQLDVLHQQMKLPYEDGKINIYERSPYTLKNVFSNMLYNDGVLKASEYLLHNKFVDDFSWNPDVIIYLHCEPEVCYQRSLSKHTDINMEYVNKLHCQHEEVFDSINCDIPIFKINVHDEKSEVYNSIVNVLNNIQQ